jgi:hypothetical protein
LSATLSDGPRRQQTGVSGAAPEWLTAFFRSIRNSATLADFRQNFRNIIRNKVQHPQHFQWPEPM